VKGGAMGKGRLEPLKRPFKKGDRVKLTSEGYKKFILIGISEGGDLAFLQPLAFENHTRTEHAFSWPKDDLIKVS